MQLLCFNRRAAWSLAAILSVIVPLGCGGETGPSKFPVTGKVSYKGKPITTGMVVFNPAGNTPNMAEGEIQPDGSYSLKTGGADGALPGEYRVTVHAFAPGVGQEGDANYKPPQPLLPAKFASLDATPLSKKVEDKENVIDLTLAD